MATATGHRTLNPDQQLLQDMEAALLDSALPSEIEDFDDAARAEAAAFILRAASNRETAQPVVLLEPLASSSPRRRMRIAIVNDDMPFLVDSVAATVDAHGLAIDRVLHPVVSVRRGKDGALTTICDAGASGERRESMIYLEVERADARERRELVDELTANLSHVRAAVTDWPQLQAAMREDGERLPDGEGAALLRWFLDRHFTQLAHEVRDRTGKQISALGIARIDGPLILATATQAKAFDWFDNGGEAPLLIKSNRIATVHRRVPLDVIVVPLRDGGKLTGISIHAGMWTSAALAAAPDKVPTLRARLAALQEKYEFDPAGHAGKALAHALGALPHDLLVGMATADLERVALTSMSLADRPRPKLETVRSSLGRHLFAFVWLPRDELSTARRVQIGDMLSKAANAPILSWSLALEDGVVALIRYTLDLREGGQVPDDRALNDRLELVVRGWLPAVEACLIERSDAGRAARLAMRYAGAFPAYFRSSEGPEEAALDILRLQDLHQAGARDARLHRLEDDAGGRLRLKLYSLGGSVPLSDAVPALENFGFRVLGETPTPLDEGKLGYIHDFHLEHEGAQNIEALLDRAGVIEGAIAAVLTGRAENDAFNKLIVSAGLDPRGTALFRAWFRYLRQTGLSYGIATVVDALRRSPAITAAILALFDARHDPERGGASEAEMQAANRSIDEALAGVAAADDDRILRLFRSVVQATLRTNAFAPAAEEALAFKIDSSKVPGLPAPIPWREIFVYSPRVEGIHLRAGPVARGGLRWSDRRDDFRTEILGLMKAQRVKNAVIVPTGAKGGFFPKMLPDPSNRDAWLAEGTESYRIFIRSLLSITDNIVGGKVVHPDKVVARDGDDPYFVVAADKGTAKFSDVANAIALERGFWLGDAFASGGSQGYDHKAMGITARGGWVSVQRHFAEMGIDVQSEPVRVVGCGDMSGDVFGNGMLLSKAIKLVAAFDHRHIFLDPDPDPAKSWAERNRLFELPRSSWEDYDETLISMGGGVFPRSAKSIKLSAPVKAMLGIEEDEIEPVKLISAILKAEVDLIWFGGIGTYVKAKAEASSDVGDPANDRLRVNGEDVRARVIGEGANLGVTQAGRIAFALRGGRINTDFIDNSAGVDCSDNEVNIKIALNREMDEGRLELADRNALLERMTGDVASLVLEDNRLQTLALSIAESGRAAALPSYVRLIDIFESSGRLDRAVEGLIGNEELLRRAQEEQGLTRPELAVLLATGKLALQDAVEAGPLGQDPALDPDLLAAFPPEMREKFAPAILGHQLRSEIVATKIANRIVNRMGLIQPFQLAEEEGCSMSDVAVVFVAAERIFDMAALWDAIDAAKISEQGRLALLDQAAAALRSHMADLLRTCGAGESVGDLIERIEPGVRRLEAGLGGLLRDEVKAQAAAFTARLSDSGAPKAIVDRVVKLYKLDGAVGLAALGARMNTDEMVLTRAFTSLGEAVGLDWAQASAIRLQPTDPWERLLTAGVARDLQQMRLDFLERAGSEDPKAYVETWLKDHAARVEQFRQVVQRARSAAVPNAAMLAQIAGQARVLLAR